MMSMIMVMMPKLIMMMMTMTVVIHDGKRPKMTMYKLVLTSKWHN